MDFGIIVIKKKLKKLQTMREMASFWSDIVFEKEVIFLEFDFETSELVFEVLKSSICKAHKFVWRGCFFLPLLSHNFNDQLSSNFHRFVILCICWDTASEKTGLWQLPIVASGFKQTNQPGDYQKFNNMPWIHHTCT